MPYTGRYSVNHERSIRSAVHSAFSNVSIVTVYNTPRAFTVKKDVLPTYYISKLIYAFECRQCASRYVGRTLQHLNARIRQHVPLHLLSTDAKKERPKRGRPRKTPIPQTDTGPDMPSSSPSLSSSSSSSSSRHSERLKSTAPGKGSDKTGSDEVGSGKVRASRGYASAIATHLSENVECRNVYSDSCFVPLSRGRSRRHLEVLESVYIHTQKPTLCIQKNNVAKLQLFKNTLSAT